MANLKATNAKLALRPKHRLNNWIHDILAIKTSYSSLFFIENIIPREIGPPENLKHYIYMLQLYYGHPSPPRQSSQKHIQADEREIEKKPTETST